MAPGLKLNTQAASQGTAAPRPTTAAARPVAATQAGAAVNGGASAPSQTPFSSTPRPQHPAQQPPRSTQPPVTATTAATSSSAQSSPPRPKAHAQTTAQTPQPSIPAHAPAPAAATALVAVPAAPPPPPAAVAAAAAAAAATSPPPPGAPADDPGPPPVSPITPPLHPLHSTTPIPPPTIPPNFASLGGRAPPLTHASHPAAVPSAPAPAPVPMDPVDFEDNPDVIALRATVGILLMQQRRAQEDMRLLREAKDAAIARPLDFLRDLSEGRIRQGPAAGDGTVQPGEDSNDDEESGEESVAEDAVDGNGDVEMKTESGGEDVMPGNGLQPSAMKAKASSSRKGKAVGAGSASRSAPAAPAPWINLPAPQDVVRCPPINWAQYAIPGEPLDRLHSEQMRQPTLGTPARLAADGTYEFTGTPNPDDGKKVEGVSAPFDPLRERVKKKLPKGAASKRGA